jgi:hypothetical protein
MHEIFHNYFSKENLLKLYIKFLLKTTQFRSVDKATEFMSCGVCIFYNVCPNIAATAAILS